MKIKQLSIFLENKAGRLAHIINTLGEVNINIRAISLADTSDFGILRLVVDDTQHARQRLKDRGFTVSITEVIAVEVQDKPGELGRILAIVEEAGLNVEYVYGPISNKGDNAILILRFEEIDKAIETMVSHGVRVLTDNS